MSGRLFHAKLLFSGQFLQHSISKSTNKFNCSSAAISNNGLGKNEYQPKRPWPEVQPEGQRMGILPRVDQLTDCQLDRCDKLFEQFRKDEVLMEGSSKEKAAKLKMDYLERLIFNTISMEGSPLSFRRMREILHASRSSRSTSNPTTICTTSKWDLEVIGIQNALELAANLSERGFNSIEDLI